MRKYFLLAISAIILSCNTNNSVPEPKKLIEPEKMETILYDLALLQAARNHSLSILEKKNIDYNTYIYKKYNIDSLQFVENNKYYAADITAYKEMFERISKKLEEEQNEARKIKPKKLSQ